MPKIGVLGGIGPEATVTFYHKLLIGLQQRGLITSNKDYPQLLINSIPAIELTGQEENEEDLQDYITGLQELDTHHPDFIVMICNTIHLYLDKLQTVVNAPILDIRQQIKKILDQKITKKYVVLGSPLTIKKGLYDFNGHQRIPLTNDIYMKLTDIINHINSGSNVAYFRSLLEEMIDTYANNGENTVILGCTELSLYSENDNPYTINSIDALVNMVIDNLHSLEKIQKSEF